jgi:2-dehydropantoate 2-reductase
MKTNAVIAVIGAGAVGCYYGGRMVERGRDVHFLMRRDCEAVRRSGLTVRSCRGDFRLTPRELRIYDDPAKMPKADLVIVTLKSTANGEFARLIRPVMKPGPEGTVILTLQNGLGNEEQLAELFGREAVLGGIAFTCINRVSAGIIEHTAHGLIRIGEFISTGKSARVMQLAEMFGTSGVECEALADLRQARWEKLLWNIPFNGLGAVMDLTTDRLLATADGEILVRRIMEDVIAAARGAEVTISPELAEKQIRNTREMGAYMTSSQVDRRAGRAIEFESLFGRPLAVARKAGVDVPWMETLVGMVKAVGRN